MYELDNPPSVIVLGEQYDNLANKLTFDCTVWNTKWPGGVYSVTYCPRPCGMKKRQVDVPCTLSGNTLTVDITRAVTLHGGDGTLVVAMRLGKDIEKRSDMMRTETGGTHPHA